MTKEPDEPFRLANVTPTTKPHFETSEPRRQTVLFSGLDCLAGQQDLFATDGRSDDTHSQEKNQCNLISAKQSIDAVQDRSR